MGRGALAHHFAGEAQLWRQYRPSKPTEYLATTWRTTMTRTTMTRTTMTRTAMTLVASPAPYSGGAVCHAPCCFARFLPRQSNGGRQRLATPYYQALRTHAPLLLLRSSPNIRRTFPPPGSTFKKADPLRQVVLAPVLPLAALPAFMVEERRVVVWARRRRLMCYGSVEISPFSAGSVGAQGNQSL